MIPRRRNPLIQGQRANAISLPSPVGGWNARDSIAKMDPLDAVSMVNWFPQTTTCKVRLGHTQYATGIPGQVETLMFYSGSTTNKLFAIGGRAIYDVTSGGAVGSAKVSGLTNSRWQYTNVATTGGNYIILANGSDAVLLFDGTTWSNPSITGVTPANLIGVNIFKNRVWFVEVGTLKAWYLPTQSISGAANSLDLSAYAPRGGYMMAMGTWTIDAGDGVDDYAVFVTSNGDVIVFQGTDPTSSATWALHGVWKLGSPVGRRCFLKWQGDLLLICQDGVVPLSGALQSSRVNPRVALTNKIQSAMSSAVSASGSNFGWQLTFYPKQNMLLLNVPVQSGSLQEQYVMNTITGSWGRFQDWTANCFEIYEDNLYFGGNTFVGKAWNTYQDNGVAIDSDILQAFNYIGSEGRRKRFTMMRPTLLSNGVPSIQANVNVDFDTAVPTTSLTVATPSGGIWDTGVWDRALWGDELSVSNLWQGVTGTGFAGAPRMIAQTDGMALEWVSTELIVEAGGML